MNYELQTKKTVIILKESSTESVNFRTPEAGVFVLGRDHMGHLVQNALYLFPNYKADIRHTYYRELANSNAPTLC